MMRSLLMGAIAGCSGTIALDVATYVDMLLRGRPSSQVPAKVVGALADQADVSLSDDPKKATNRRQALGALLGYATGISVGTTWGILRRSAPDTFRSGGVPASVLVGGLAMAASDVPSSSLGATDPSSWGASGWLADIVPHAIYGLVTVAVLELLDPV